MIDRKGSVIGITVHGVQLSTCLNGFLRFSDLAEAAGPPALNQERGGRRSACSQSPCGIPGKTSWSR